MTTAQKKPAAKTAKAAPEVVGIAWWNRPITWGVGLLVLLLFAASAIIDMGGPEVVTAQPVDVAEVVETQPIATVPEKPEVVIPLIIKADNGAVVIIGGEDVRVDRPDEPDTE